MNTKRKMRITILTKVFPPFSFGGSETYTMELARQLSSLREVETHILCFAPAEKEVVEKIERKEGYQIHVVGVFFKRFRLIGSLVNYIKTYFSLLKTLKQLKPDVLQTIGIYSETIFALSIARKLRIPVVVFPRGSDLNKKLGFFRSIIYKYGVFGRADAIFSQTLVALQSFKKQSLLGKGEKELLLKVIPNALDISGLPEGKKEEGGKEVFRVLWVGRFEKVKRPFLALKIFSRFVEMVKERGEEGVQLVMVGDGSLFEELKEEAKKLNNVVLKGKLEREEIFQLMAGGDVLINTSSSEGFPMTFLEGMAYGLPIVCFEVSANSEIVRDGENGFVVRERDLHLFAERLFELFSSPEMRLRIGEKNRKKAEEYSWKHILPQILEVYEALAKRKK